MGSCAAAANADAVGESPNFGATELVLACWTCSTCATASVAAGVDRAVGEASPSPNRAFVTKLKASLMASSLSAPANWKAVHSPKISSNSA